MCSAYECGRKRPSPATEQRLLAAARAGSGSPIHRYRLLTVPGAAAALRRAVREDWPVADRPRLVRELRSNARHLGSERDFEAFYARPSTTGDTRWDALLAGVAEMDALEAGRVAPAWTRGRALPYSWFVSPSRALDAYAFARTPPSLSIHGIAIDGSDLSSL